MEILRPAPQDSHESPSSSSVPSDASSVRAAQCSALKAAGLQDQLLLPGNAAYEKRIESWWSASARLRPWCIVQPRTTQDVSKAVVALSRLSAGHFAVRSGGHCSYPGGSNIDNGVTIDLAHLNEITYVPGSSVVSLGPAQRWGSVFQALEAHGVMTVGGREGNVGVGGFLTGGGVSYHSGRHGYACDNIVNAEVVLADGRIVQANASENADLWKALKGGSSNFGIVTRFDMPVFPAGQVWGGWCSSDKSYASQVIEALVNFTNNSARSPEAALLVFSNYQSDKARGPTPGQTTIGQIIVDTDGVADPPIFNELREIPKLFNDVKKRPLSDLVGGDNLLPTGRRDIWFTLTVKNDARMVQKGFDLHDAFLDELLPIIPQVDMISRMIFQPVTKSVSDIGVSKGGNVLGLDSVEGNSLMWLIAVSIQEAEHEALVRAKAAAMTAALEQYATSIDALVPWQYLNYAEPSQNPLESYGPENLRFLNTVSQKYDPMGFFQSRMPGSFRLTRAG